MLKAVVFTMFNELGMKKEEAVCRGKKIVLRRV